MSGFLTTIVTMLRPNQYPLGAHGEYTPPRQEVDCRGMLSKLSLIKIKRTFSCECAFFFVSLHSIIVTLTTNPHLL